jgi:hypothetical protein
MSLTIDYNAATADVIAPGTYEVIIKAAYEDVTKSSNKPFIAVNMVVRNDVKQNFTNFMIFYKLWKRKEPTKADMAVKGFSVGKLMGLAKAAAIPNGTKFETLDDLLNALVRKTLKVTITHDGEYNGQPNVNVKSVVATTMKPCTHAWKTAEPADLPPGGFLERVEDDEDLPF